MNNTIVLDLRQDLPALEMRAAWEIIDDTCNVDTATRITCFNYEFNRTLKRLLDKKPYLVRITRLDLDDSFVIVDKTRLRTHIDIFNKKGV
jgi:hypothetical protein